MSATHTRRRVVSLALWAVAAVGAFWLWHVQRPEAAALPGLVEAVPMPVGPVEAGRITAIHVVSGQAVAAGDPLVSLDTTAIDAELAVARAELAEALAELDAERTERTRLVERDRLEAAARLAEARAQADSAAVERAAVNAELRALEAEIERLDPIVEQGVAGYDSIGQLTARKQRLASEARHLPDAAAAWRSRTDRLEALFAALQAADPAAALAPLEARIRTQSRRIEALLRRHAAAVLRAPRDARVTRVHLGPGASVTVGVPIVDLLARDPERLVAWLPEATARRIHPGDTVAIDSIDRAVATRVEGVVEELGPGIIEMPRRLWTDHNTPRFGRPIHVRLPRAGGGLLPDERVSVNVVTADAPGGALAADAPSDITDLVVPSALADRTRVEISGALWLPERARFLVVSDDTGHADRDDGAPWVLLVDKDGRLDPAPVPIDGIKKISDLEAITRAPDGAIWLLCSQSQSKKGKRPKKRQWLLRTRLEGDRLRVDGATRLFELLTDLPADTRAALGVDESLDLEGLTWRDGGLLFGVKAPLDSSGRARIWRLDRPDAIFDGGLGGSPDGGGAALRPEAALSLPTGVGGTPGGISDLFADGSALYVLSTLAEGPATGAAWRVDHRDAPPIALGAWPDHKPEAIARGPRGLRVFFDNGGAPPSWAPLDGERR